MKTNNFSSTLIVLPILLLSLGCASKTKQAQLIGDPSPQSQLQTLEKDMALAEQQNLDILAASEFKKSKSAFHEAKSDFKAGENKNEVIADIQRSRYYLNEAYEVAEPRRGAGETVFAARQAAILAGAPLHRRTNSKLDKMDRRLERNVDDLQDMDGADLAELQADYMQLARESAVQTQLGDSIAIVGNVRRFDLDDRAPQTYKRAEVSLESAKSVVETNINQPEAYASAVGDANLRAYFLRDVLAVIRENKNDITEVAAADIVNQRRQIANLDQDLDAANAQNTATSDALAKNRRALASLTPSVMMQKALETARSSFTTEEAEAYQMGDKLLIRLKSMKFPIGNAGLPSTALPVLAKVGNVASDLSAQEIQVQGHTDSTGSAAVNEKLSQARAEAVAAYFKTNSFEDVTVNAEGRGYSQPIASNKTKMGREQNRRVDVIITPATAARDEEALP